MKEQKEKYESPFMERTFVELESGFCAASAQPATISSKSTIKVEEYETIDNKITFD